MRNVFGWLVNSPIYQAKRFLIIIISRTNTYSRILERWNEDKSIKLNLKFLLTLNANVILKMCYICTKKLFSCFITRLANKLIWIGQVSLNVLLLMKKTPHTHNALKFCGSRFLSPTSVFYINSYTLQKLQKHANVIVCSGGTMGIRWSVSVCSMGIKVIKWQRIYVEVRIVLGVSVHRLHFALSVTSK